MGKLVGLEEKKETKLIAVKAGTFADFMPNTYAKFVSEVNSKGITRKEAKKMAELVIDFVNEHKFGNLAQFDSNLSRIIGKKPEPGRQSFTTEEGLAEYFEKLPSAKYFKRIYKPGEGKEIGEPAVDEFSYGNILKGVMRSTYAQLYMFVADKKEAEGMAAYLVQYLRTHTIGNKKQFDSDLAGKLAGIIEEKGIKLSALRTERGLKVYLERILPEKEEFEKYGIELVAVPKRKR